MTSRSPRGSLHRHVVLDAALDMIDRVGVDGLTIRGLAKELGRPPMSLYTHFRSKNDLLDLAYERLFQRLFTVQDHAAWQVDFERSCRHMRELLLRHPRWVPLLTRVRVPPAALPFYDRMLDGLSRDGFRPDAALFAFSTVISHALGSVLVERMLGGDPPIPRQQLDLVKGMIAEFPRGAYPRVAAAARRFDHWSFDRVFDVGCHALIVGLDESLPRRGARRNHHQRRPIDMTRVVGGERRAASRAAGNGGP